MLGGKCIHVESGYSPTRPFRLYPCRATATTASAQQTFDTETDIDTAFELKNDTEFKTNYETDDELEDDIDDDPNISNFFCVDPHRGCYGIMTLGIPRSCMTTRRQRMPSMQTLMDPSRTMQDTGAPILDLRGISVLSQTRPWDPWPTKAAMRLPVKPLRTCRQLYHEMNQILYSANTFCFQRPFILTHFATCLGKKASVIRHLHLHIAIDNASQEKEWNRALRTAVQRFSNLCSVDISIDQSIWNCTHPRQRENPSMSTDNTFLVGMSAFRKLKFLRTMTLVVTDKYPWQAWEPSEFLWSTPQKQKWVQDVKADILGRNKT